MENISLNAVVRENGKGASAILRRNGMIPAVIYGGLKGFNVAINAREFNAKFRVVSENQIVELDVDGTVVHVLIKDYQKDYLKDKMLHIDFFEVTKGKELKTHIPVKVVNIGKSVGERAGGLLEVHLHELEVVCLPKDLPSGIIVDVADLGVGSSIHISDIKIPNGVRVTNSPETVIVVIDYPKGESSSEEAVAEADAN